MSYDVSVTCHTCCTNLMGVDNNIFISGVWSVLGVDLDELDGKPVRVVLPTVQRVINRVANMDDSDRNNLNARFGGNYVDDAVEFLYRLRDAMCLDPAGRIEVSS